MRYRGVIRMLMLLAFAVISTDTVFSYRLGFALTVLYTALFGDAAGDLLMMPLTIRQRECTLKIQASVCLLCTAAYFLFGTINMQTVTGNRLTITSEKIRHNHTLAFVSDMHVGSSQSLHTTEKTIQKIASESPECIILGGDIVDEYTTKEEIETVFSWFGGLNIPVYFIYGNHDRQPNAERADGLHFTPQELEAALHENSINVLKDEWIYLDSDLVILGREDASSDERLPLRSIKPRPEGVFVLLIDHSPYQYDEIAVSDADLQLSGHTHAGQIFPLQWIYEVAGFTAYGSYRHGNTDTYVSSGASGWQVPFRTEAACHYEIVSLVAS